MNLKYCVCLGQAGQIAGLLVCNSSNNFPKHDDSFVQIFPSDWPGQYYKTKFGKIDFAYKITWAKNLA